MIPTPQTASAPCLYFHLNKRYPLLRSLWKTLVALRSALA